MNSCSNLVCLILILALGPLALAGRNTFQADYESLFACIKKIVPSVYQKNSPLLPENYEKAKSYLELIAVFGNSSEVVKTVSQYCLSGRPLPANLQGLANQQQTAKVIGLLTDFTKPRMRCKKIGYEETAGALLAVSIKLIGAKCSSSIGEEWFQFMPGAGVGFGVGSVRGVSFGEHERNGTEAWDDSGSTGVRIGAAYGVGISLELNSAFPGSSTGMAAVTTTPITSFGPAIGVGIFAMYEGQLSFEVYKRPLRVDYLLDRLGFDGLTINTPDIQLK